MPVEEIPALESRKKLEDEMMAWDRDRREYTEKIRADLHGAAGDGVVVEHERQSDGDREAQQPRSDCKVASAAASKQGGRIRLITERRKKAQAAHPEATGAELDCYAGCADYPRPVDPYSERALRARMRAERIRRTDKGEWSPARRVPDIRRIPLDELPPIESRHKLEQEMVAWEPKRRKQYPGEQRAGTLVTVELMSRLLGGSSHE
jgi:hypothetical protein